MTGPFAVSPKRRHVPSTRAASLVFSVLIRQIVTPGRLFALGLLSLAMIVVAWPLGVSIAEDALEDASPPPLTEELASDAFAEAGAVDRQATLDAFAQEQSKSERLRAGASYVDLFGLVFIVPIVSLVFASAALGDPREDGTLVYLWLRPMARSAVVAGAVASACAVALPFTVIPCAVGGWLATGRVSGSGSLVSGSVAAAALGTVAYSSLFVLVGLLFRKPILWGIAYVLIWEGTIAGISGLAADTSLRGHVRSLLQQISDTSLGAQSRSAALSAAILAAVSTGAFILSSWRLKKMEVT